MAKRLLSQIADLGFCADSNPLDEEEDCKDCGVEPDENEECPHCKHEDEIERAEHEYELQQDRRLDDAIERGDL